MGEGGEKQLTHVHVNMHKQTSMPKQQRQWHDKVKRTQSNKKRKGEKRKKEKKRWRLVVTGGAASGQPMYADLGTLRGGIRDGGVDVEGLVDH